MNTFSRPPMPGPTLTVVIRWVARIGGLLFIVATACNDGFFIAETVVGHGPNWATLSANDIATVVLALGLPLVSIAGVVIAWLRTGIGEGIGGALIVVAALVAMIGSLIVSGAGDVSMALTSLPMALVGAGFLYCWWDTTRHAHPQQAGTSVS